MLRRKRDHDPRAFAQANVGGLAQFSLQFWLLACLTGVAAGVGAIAMMALLHTVQHLAFAYHTGEYSTAAAARSAVRRVVVVTIGGVVAGLGWWVLRTKLGGSGGEPTRAVWSGSGEMSLWRTVISGAISEVMIGLGGSLGREAAPQHAGAAFGAWIGRHFELPREQRLLLIACGAGAGVGAVYNVPLAGALFAAELYLSSISLAAVVPALVTSGIATAIGWLYLPKRPIYPVPALPFPSASLLIFALLSGPLIGLAAAGFVKLIVWASDHRPSGRALLLQPPLAFAVLGALAIPYPLLLGNGRDLAVFAFRAQGALGTLAALALLKPLVTAMCLRSGASGGLFTPTLSTGAVAGAFLGHVWAHIWPGASLEACSIVGAAAMLGTAMRAPMAAIAFTIELTDTVNASMVAILLALAGALLVARALERRSIYTARLPAVVRARSVLLGPERDRRRGDQHAAAQPGPHGSSAGHGDGGLEPSAEAEQNLAPGGEAGRLVDRGGGDAHGGSAHDAPARGGSAHGGGAHDAPARE